MRHGRRSLRAVAAIVLTVIGILTVFPAGNAVRNPFPRAGSAIAFDGPNPPEIVPGELLVKFREPVTAAVQGQVHQALGSQELEQIEGLGVARVALEPGVTVEEAVRRYEAMPGVEYAEPSYIVRIAVIPSDPLFASSQQWYYDLIEGPAAWDQETGDASVVVAVLDTGIDASHPDLKDGLWTNPHEIEANDSDDDDNGCVDDSLGCNFITFSDISCQYKEKTPNNQIEDDNGHGTFVAGIVAARANNQIGVTGSAPGVTIMPVKVLDCTGSGTTAAAANGVLYAARAGADVINMSFGSDNESAALKDALQQAHDVFGTVIVASAGNMGEARVSYPARNEDVIAVSASDHSRPDAKVSFSNWGPEVDVAAPGVDIVSTVPRRLCNNPWSCIDGQPYATGDGTSFSTALVSGTAALILSRSPTMTADEVTEQITATALDLPDGSFTNWDGSGRIQMEQALQTAVYRIGASGVTRN